MSSNPLDIAVIGTGNRSRTVYLPLFQHLKPWVRVVAVCDPVREHADSYAEKLGVPAFYSLRDLVQSQPMEAALVIAPIDAHHSISCYLSQHGIHNLVETSMANLLAQAQEMVDMARRHNVVLRIAENFFRFPFDRIAKKIAQTNFLEPIKRLTCYHDHTGFHNNSRWIVFYGAHPVSVQAIEHVMPVAPHYSMPHRFHTEETFRARFFTFPDNNLVVDFAANIKGLLGRYPRPGYTALDGGRGAIVREATRQWYGEAEVRYCTDEALQSGGKADQIFPIIHHAENGWWASTYVDLPIGRVEYVNPHRPAEGNITHHRDYYLASVMDHIVDFAQAVWGAGTSEYTDEDALMAMMMEVGAHESALHDGIRLTLPLEGELEAEREMRESLRQKHGVDPLDIDGMLELSFPRP